MRKFFILLVAVTSMLTLDTFAQQSSEAKKAAAKAKREQLMQTRLELLKTELGLTDVQMEKFAPVYRKYRSEIQKATSSNREARTKKANITNENALKVVSARLTNNILTSAIKQRYLLIFAEVIEPMQVMKLYNVDSKISKEASKIMKYRNTATSMDKKR
ncbi:MAG: hypothetical protein E7148_07925 [Rikenellaceae bacterium]|nr:hypothetical protein [Rikenellaceae bacterium]